MTSQEIYTCLLKYAPQEAVSLMTDLVMNYRIFLKITPARKSKFGDYRSPFGRNGHRISINRNLNPYAFVITFVHEVAHLVTWEKYKNKVKPHGEEWKNNFRIQMQPFFEVGAFPPDIEKSLQTYLQNPAASSCRDENLYKTLQKYNTIQEEEASQTVVLDSLPTNSFFIFKKRLFQKHQKMRKYVKCTEIQTGTTYRILASVCIEEYQREH